ncbi:MAG TPA: RcpC/CpaB family pilus assembly protein [Candidatus Lumbricidophila sp.]|nr:RcpC/CpaB family pilus assembly protein [Candidatus Lumbricidophila sp.]
MIRVIGAIVALVLTIGGAIALSIYVGSAESRAQNGAKIQQVYVVADAMIPRGTSAESITDKIKIVEIPAIAVQPNHVTDLKKLVGKVTNADLLPGEQLLTGRFASPGDLDQAIAFPVPKGLSEVTITLPVERAVGGVIKPGDYLGVVATTSLPSAEATLPMTKSTLHQLLVTRVALGSTYAPPSDAKADSKDSTTKEAQPEISTIMITVAVTIPQAEQLVFLAEMTKRKPAEPDDAAPYAEIWALLESKESNVDGSSVRTKDTVFQ